MNNDRDRAEQTQGAQPGSQGQHGKGQSNPGGFDQQSSSSMEREQANEDRMRNQQSQQSDRQDAGNE